jgi:hypothetical protein
VKLWNEEYGSYAPSPQYIVAPNPVMPASGIYTVSPDSMLSYFNLIYSDLDELGTSVGVGVGVGVAVFVGVTVGVGVVVVVGVIVGVGVGVGVSVAVGVTVTV